MSYLPSNRSPGKYRDIREISYASLEKYREILETVLSTEAEKTERVKTEKWQTLVQNDY